MRPARNLVSVKNTKIVGDAPQIPCQTAQKPLAPLLQLQNAGQSILINIVPDSGIIPATCSGIGHCAAQWVVYRAGRPTAQDARPTGSGYGRPTLPRVGSRKSLDWHCACITTPACETGAEKDSRRLGKAHTGGPRLATLQCRQRLPRAPTRR